MNYQDTIQLIEQYQSSGGDMNNFLSHVSSLASDGATPFLQLNQWKSSDKPVMKDFNEDNQKIDDAVRRLSEQKAEKSEVQTKVNINGSSVMTGSLQAPQINVNHNSSNDYANVYFFNEGKRVAAVISDKRGNVRLRVNNPDNDTEYKDLNIRWDGNITWNGKRVVTE